MLFRVLRIETLKSAAIIVALLLLIACASVIRVPAQGRALSLADVLIALRSKKAESSEKNKILADAVKQRGVTFTLSADIQKELESTGAASDLILAIREKAPSPPPVVAAVKEAAPAPKPVEDFSFFRTRATAEMSSDTTSAMADLDRAITLKPDDPGVHHDKAMLLATKGSSNDAIAEYTKASELAPQDPRNFAGRAASYEKLGKQVEALGDYQKVLALAPADAGAAASVVRISSALTRAAMDASVKQQQQSSAVEKAAAAPPAENATIASTTPIHGLRTADPATAADIAAGPIEIGNLTSYCKDLVKPVYPQTALQLHAGGEVNVSVTLDEDGKVIDVKAKSGAASLRAAAENAARRSKFAPVVKNGKPVKATGSIVYNFTLGGQ